MYIRVPAKRQHRQSKKSVPVARPIPQGMRAGQPHLPSRKETAMKPDTAPLFVGCATALVTPMLPAPAGDG